MSCGHYHGSFNHYRGPSRTKLPIPKSRVELFLVFEGCLRHSTLWELLVAKNLPLPGSHDGEEKVARRGGVAGRGGVAEVEANMVLLQPANPNIVEQRLQFCVNALRGDMDAITRVATELAQDASDNGVRYFEVRFSPHKFLKTDSGGNKNTEEENEEENEKEDKSCGPSVEDLVNAVLRGLKEGLADTVVESGLILSGTRGKHADTRELLGICDKLRDVGVVALDLGGEDTDVQAVVAEDGGSVESLLFGPEDIAIFEEARKLKIHRTVHAGEASPPEMIFQALEKLHAERIVCGYTVIQDHELYLDCINNKIHFETCPTSSIVRGAVSLANFYHPVIQFAEDNVNFSISSGYPVLTGGWLVQEIEMLMSWGLTESHIANAMFNAGRSSFQADSNKKHLMKDLRKSYGMEDKIELEIFINHKCGLPDDPRKVLKTSF